MKHSTTLQYDANECNTYRIKTKQFVRARQAKIMALVED